jgi:hypothetical protein
MDDREIAEIIRKRNLAYVKHLNKTSPHTQSHDKLEGGFLSAVAAAAKIAAKMAIRAAKAGAKTAAKKAKDIAKAAARAAKAAGKAAKKIAKSKKLETLDKLMTVADVAQAGYAIAQNLMKKSKEGVPISDAEFNKLTAAQQIEIDFQRWARGLERADYEMFKKRGGDKTAAMQLARLMDAGADPDDWVGNELTATLETAKDQLEDLEEYDPEDDDECEGELDKDDRSQLEINGLIALSLLDQGIGEAISEAQLEQRQKARRNACVARKKKEKQDAIDKIKLSLGIKLDAPFDLETLEDNMDVKGHILDTMAAKNPNVKLALELDGPRSMAGMPPIDPAGKVFDSPENKYNNDLELLSFWFIQNNTIDPKDIPESSETKPDQNWLKTRVNDDPYFVQRAIAKMKYVDFFCSNLDELRYQKAVLTDEFTPLTPEQARLKFEFDKNPDWNKDQNYNEGDTVYYNAEKPGVRNENGIFYKAKQANTNKKPQAGYDIAEFDNRNDGKSFSMTEEAQAERAKIPNQFWAAPYDFTYEKRTVNKEGFKALANLEALLDAKEEEINQAVEAVTKFEEREEALSAKESFVPNKQYKERDLIRYGGKVYKCKVDHTSGDTPDFTKWDELILYNDEDYKYLENIGTATPYQDHIVYPVDTFVKYQDRIFKKIKHSGPPVEEEEEEEGEGEEGEVGEGGNISVQQATSGAPASGAPASGAPASGAPASGIPPGAGILPTDPEYWDEILLKDGDLIDLQTNPGRRWSASTIYKVGDKVLNSKDLQTYVCIKAGGGIGPDSERGKEFWRRLITYDIDPELAKELVKTQKLAIFSSVIGVAKDYDSDDIYKMHDIVYAFDGKYYELIKEKKNKEGEVIQPPIPPNQSYWKVVSKGLTVWDPNELYTANDFVEFEGKNYFALKQVKGGLPSRDIEFWEPLDEKFAQLDAEAIAINKQSLNNAIIARSDEYQEGDSYQIGDIVKVDDDEGFPQFYECIKDIPEAKEYDNYIVYRPDDLMIFNNQTYQMTSFIGATGYNPLNSTGWTPVYTGPPTKQYWRDYAEVDIEEEKIDKLRKSAKKGSQDAVGIKVGDIVSEPLTGLFYKLISSRSDDKAEYTMKALPYFDNRRKSGDRGTGHLTWQLQDIPTALESEIANLEKKSKWKNNKLYVRDDLVIDKYGLKYLVIKDTPYAPMEPYFSPDYFIPLSDDDWEDAIHEATQALENLNDVAVRNESIRHSEEDVDKPRIWGEIVFHDNKFYKFFAYGQTDANNTPTKANQKIPGKLENGYHPPLEWYPCDSDGNLLIVEEKDYTINLKEPYIYKYNELNKGPIISTDGIYLIYNGFDKKIFGLGEGQFSSSFGTGRDWGALGDKDHRPDPQDTYATEVFKDGKPKFKHDDSGAIIGTNIDTSSLPPSTAADITDIANEQDCPTAQDNGDDSPTHHEITQAERDLEKATIEAKVKGEEPPALIQGQNTTTPSVGTASGYNIEELDGSRYHQKKKRVYKKKNKSKM